MYLAVNEGEENVQEAPNRSKKAPEVGNRRCRAEEDRRKAGFDAGQREGGRREGRRRCSSEVTQDPLYRIARERGKKKKERCSLRTPSHSVESEAEGRRSLQ
jgi:hypothetical protein